MTETEKLAEYNAAAEWLETADWFELNDSVLEAFDGCDVEPDGRCPHGFSSPLLVLGII